MANVLVIGSGGREHALARTLAQNSKVYVAPGNGGTENNVQIKPDDFGTLADFVVKEEIDLTVVGSEGPLANGIVDYFKTKRLRIFGPTKEAAEIESSKIFAKNLMENNNIPTAKYFIVEPQRNSKAGPRFAENVLNKYGGVVIKDDALAAGKGVTVCNPANAPEGEDSYKWALNKAENALQEIKNKGHAALIEEMLIGEEFSYIGVTDGDTFVPFLPSQDHKPVYDGDKGPNTGGMGAYAPAPVVTKEVNEEMLEIMNKTIEAMKRKGMPYQGALYAGCMMTENGPKVIEFNCRFGDPETQPILSLFKGDLYKVLDACATGKLKKVEDEFKWRDGAACCVVLASGGYPLDGYKKGFEINGLENLVGREDIAVFHAGTKKEWDKIITSGGRVLGVTGIGPDIKEAISIAYSGAEKVSFFNMYYRTDIGLKALRRLK